MKMDILYTVKDLINNPFSVAPFYIAA